MANEDIRCRSEFSDLGTEYQCIKHKGHVRDGDEWHEDQYENKWNKRAKGD